MRLQNTRLHSRNSFDSSISKLVEQLAHHLGQYLLVATESLYQETDPPGRIPPGTPDEWLFDDWQLIARALTATMHEDCQCYECDTIDTLLGDIAHYWDLTERELAEAIA